MVTSEPSFSTRQGHRDVHHDNVGLENRNRVEHAPPVRHGPEDRVVPPEHPDETIENCLVVVDEQDTRLRQCAAARQTE